MACFLKEIQAAQQGLDEGQNRILTMYILKSFFALPYDGRDFYVQFEERMKKQDRIWQWTSRKERKHQ